VKRLALIVLIPFAGLLGVLHITAADAQAPSTLPDEPGVNRTSPHGSTWSVSQNGSILQIAFGSGTDFPQYAALHLDSSYFRPIYSPTSTFGTSAILMPPFWSGGQYYQSAPISATWQVDGLDLRVLTTGTQMLSGSVGSLTAFSELRLSPPSGVTLTAWIKTQVSGTPELDPGRPGETFKPAMLSSMRVSPLLWDTKLAYAGGLTFTLPISGWIVQPPVVTDVFGLVGGTSCWKENAPTIEVVLDRPMQITGWVTPSSNPNDDNVGWWAATDVVVPSWSYTLTAMAAPGPHVYCRYLPAVLKNYDARLMEITGILRAGDMCVSCCYPTFLETAEET
jgi:hypothetical protein